MPNVPIFDEDNYTCTNGLCVFAGCLGDAECEATYPNLGFVCRTLYPNTPPSCVESCQSVNDCISDPNSPLVNADNYSCENGYCSYTGCNNDGECEAHYANPDYVCKNLVPGYPATCVLSCQNPAICPPSSPLPAYDADNYSCAKGYCEYLGCKDTAECEGSFPGKNYVCE